MIGKEDMQTNNGPVLLDALLTEFKIKNDSALAEWLQVSQPHISRTRNGGTVTDAFILTVHEKSGWPVTAIRALLRKS